MLYVTLLLLAGSILWRALGFPGVAEWFDTTAKVVVVLFFAWWLLSMAPDRPDGGGKPLRP